jgi:hypothetical protein
MRTKSRTVAIDKWRGRLKWRRRFVWREGETDKTRGNGDREIKECTVSER